MAKTETKRRRAKKDPALRLRAWAWYWHVRRVSGMSDYRLDLEIMRETKDGIPLDMIPTSRPRAFEKIRKSGSDPNRKDRRRGFSLVERVEEAYPGTAARYHSPFWRLIRPPVPQLAELKEFLHSHLRALGLGRLSGLSYTQLRAETDFTSDPLTCWPHDGFSAPLDGLARLGTLDALTVLTCLLLESKPTGDYELQLHLGDWATRCLGVFCKQEDVVPFRDQLWRVFRERILLGNWSLHQDSDLQIHEPAPMRYNEPLIPLMDLDGCNQIEEHLQEAAEEFLTRIKTAATEYVDERRKLSYADRNIPPWDSKCPLNVGWPQ